MRRNIAFKLSATLLAGMMVSGVAMAEGQKNAGPSAKETVEFVNGLLSCEIPSVVPTSPQVTVMEYQTATLAIEGKNLLLTEAIDASFDSSRMSTPRHRVETNRVILTPNDLVTDVSVTNEIYVKLSCNPSVGACIHTKVIGKRGFIGQAMATEGEVDKTLKEGSFTDYWMNFCDADKAQRAAKAMKHLIEISGGKKSLF